MNLLGKGWISNNWIPFFWSRENSAQKANYWSVVSATHNSIDLGLVS